MSCRLKMLLYSRFFSLLNSPTLSYRSLLCSSRVAVDSNAGLGRREEFVALNTYVIALFFRWAGVHFHSHCALCYFYLRMFVPTSRSY